MKNKNNFTSFWGCCPEAHLADPLVFLKSSKNRGVGYYFPYSPTKQKPFTANSIASIITEARNNDIHLPKWNEATLAGQKQRIALNQETFSDDKISSTEPLLEELSFRNCYSEVSNFDKKSVESVYNKWISRKGAEAAAKLVKKCNHKILYSLDSNDVEKCCSETVHALGKVSKRKLSRYSIFQDINNYNASFAFMHIFHKIMEETGTIPRWQDVRSYCNDNPDILLNDYRDHFKYHESSDEIKRVLNDGLKWRMGCSYYSFLREVDFFVKMREHYNVDLRYHLFADVTLGIDFWVNDCIISLFIGNSEFRTASGQGRKRKSSLTINNDALRFIDVDLSCKNQRGHVWLVGESEIERVAMLTKHSIQ